MVGNWLRFQGLMNRGFMMRAVSVRALENFRLKIVFQNKKAKIVDVSGLLRGPMFSPLKNKRKFKAVRVNKEFGCVEWPNGADLCPDALYYGGTPPWARK